MAKQSKTRNKKGRYIVKENSVIEFVEEDSDERLFECIPNSWFVDENKKSCFWPPKCGTKSMMQRAINCEKPDDTWSIYACVVVSTGHLSYAAGFKVVREKCSQKYNTSSADKRITESNFRRQHPVLALQQGTRSFKEVFSRPNASVDVHQSETGDIMNASDKIFTKEFEDEIRDLANESRLRNEPQYRSTAKEPLNRTEANTSRNIRESRVSRSRSISRNRSTAKKPVSISEASTLRNICERRVSRSLSNSRSSSSDRSYSQSNPSQSSRDSQRSSEHVHVNSGKNLESDIETGDMRRAYQSTSRRSESGMRRSSYDRSNSKARSCRAADISFRSQSNHSNSGRSRSRSPVRDNRSHSTFRESESVDASRSGINYLVKLVEKFSQRQVEHERRLNRIEVSINKTLILVGDLSNSNNLYANPAGLINRQMDAESDMDINEFEVPKIPIQNLDELFTIQNQLQNRRFKRFLVKHERDFCTPSKIGTHTVTLTKYLKRFISLHVRCKLTLKEKTLSGYTLMGDFNRVYTYLIDLMRAGYQNCNRILTVDEAHTALRTVWGRSKQQNNEEQQKKIKQKRLDHRKKKSDGSRRHRRRPYWETCFLIL